MCDRELLGRLGEEASILRCLELLLRLPQWLKHSKGKRQVAPNLPLLQGDTCKSLLAVNFEATLSAPSHAYADSKTRELESEHLKTPSFLYMQSVLLPGSAACPSDWRLILINHF